MSRGWWGWMGYEARATAPLTASEPESVPVIVPPPPRLSGQQGTVTLLCVTPSGGKSDHPTEQAALNRAAMSAGAVVYPVVVEEQEKAG